MVRRRLLGSSSLKAEAERGSVSPSEARDPRNGQEVIAPEDDFLVDPVWLQRRWGIARSPLNRMIKDGRMPEPERLGPATRRWWYSTIRRIEREGFLALQKAKTEGAVGTNEARP